MFLFIFYLFINVISTIPSEWHKILTWDYFPQKYIIFSDIIISLDGMHNIIEFFWSQFTRNFNYNIVSILDQTKLLMNSIKYFYHEKRFSINLIITFSYITRKCSSSNEDKDIRKPLKAIKMHIYWKRNLEIIKSKSIESLKVQVIFIPRISELNV